MKKNHRRCRLCDKEDPCCDRPHPVSYHWAEHKRGVSIADLPGEALWWFECYSCEFVCTCEV